MKTIMSRATEKCFKGKRFAETDSLLLTSFATTYSVERTLEYFVRTRGKQIGDEINVKILGIFPNNFVSFWPREADGSLPSEQMCARMSLEIASSSALDIIYPLECPKPDQPVAVLLEKFGWARGLVVENSPNFDEFSVRLIDFGIIRNVSKKQLRPLEKKFAEEPPAAFTAEIQNLKKNCFSEIDSNFLLEILSTEFDENFVVSTIIVQLKPSLILQFFINDFDIILCLRKANMIQKGHQVQLATITFASNGDEIFLLPIDRHQELKRIQVAVQMDASADFPPHLNLNSVNAVQFDDGLFYRGVILEKKKNRFEIFFKDFGNKSFVTVDKIRGLSPILRTIKSPISLFGLADFSPLESDHPMLKSILNEENSQFFFEILKLKSKSESDSKSNLNSDSDLDSKSKSKSNSNLEKIRLFDENCVEITTSRLVSEKKNPGRKLFYPVENTVTLTESQAELEESVESQFFDVFLQQGYELKMTDLCLNRNFRPGDTFSAYARFVMDPDFIYLVCDDAVEEEHQKQLASELKKNISGLPKFRKLPEVETVVCARYDIDKKWYRAGILSHKSEFSAEVIFIDFGNDGTVNIDDIRPLTENLAKFPQMVIPAVIGGITAPPGGFTQQNRLYAEDILLSARAVFRVLENDQENLIGDLFLVEKGTGKRRSVADMYIKRGVAVPKRGV